MVFGLVFKKWIWLNDITFMGLLHVLLKKVVFKTAKMQS